MCPKSSKWILICSMCLALKVKQNRKSIHWNRWKGILNISCTLSIDRIDDDNNHQFTPVCWISTQYTSVKWCIRCSDGLIGNRITFALRIPAAQTRYVLFFVDRTYILRRYVHSASYRISRITCHLFNLLSSLVCCVHISDAERIVTAFQIVEIFSV